MTPPGGRPVADDPLLPMSLRATTGERDLIQQAAKKRGQRLTTWMREQLVAAAKRELRKP